MAETEACKLLRGLLQNDKVFVGEASALSSRLECLPLALAQAAAFIQENSISVGNYIELPDEGDSALVERLSEPFATVGRDSATSHAVTATWILTFQQIERQDSLASDILRYFVFSIARPSHESL
jgi:hypothetical protein